MSPATATPLMVNVTVGDTWMQLHLAAKPDETVAALKARALASQRIDPARAAQYEVKLGGARIVDETRTLAAAGVKNGAPLIVLARRRRPVR